MPTVNNTGAFTATGTSAPAGVYKEFNFSVWGTFVGTVALERSLDGGTTWMNASRDAAGTANAFTAAASVVCSEPEMGALYRVNCSAYTSGTINYRLSQ